MSAAKQRQILIGLLALLGALVAADQFGLLPGGGAESSSEASDEAPSARSLYLAGAELAEKRQALIDQAPQWRQAFESAQREWSVARQRMIVERSVELAEARFRDRALESLKDLGLTSLRVTPIQDRAPVTGAPPEAVVVKSLTMEVKFDAANHRDVYAAIDRLETMPGMATNISMLRIEGPGRVQLPHTITVTLTLQAQAAVGEEIAANG